MSPQDFYAGCDRKRASAELIALSKIPSDLRAKESALFTTKWFDYRVMHPVQATAYFAHVYEESVRAHYRETQDYQDAEKLRIFPGDPVLGRDLIALTVARQAFDALGVRYEWAIPWVLKRAGERGWRTAPRPNQLYGEEMLLDLKDAWADECRASLQTPRRAKPEIIEQPTMVQAAFEDWLLQEVRKRAIPQMEWMILHGLLSRRLVTRDGIRKHFGEAILSRVVSASP
jgi:hypothetical protein